MKRGNSRGTTYRGMKRAISARVRGRQNHTGEDRKKKRGGDGVAEGEGGLNPKKGNKVTPTANSRQCLLREQKRKKWLDI